MLASSAIRLAAARAIAPGSLAGACAGFEAGEGDAALLHPHEPLPQPPVLAFAGAAFGPTFLWPSPGAAVQVVSMSSGGTTPTSPVFQLIGSTDA